VSKRPATQKRESKRVSRVEDFDEEAVEILRYRGRYLVVDTDSDLIFIGKLLEVTGRSLTLEDADVHDRRDSSSKNEKYVLDSKKHGVRSNRKTVHLRLQRVVSYSLLEDVTDY
jgi:hypothetical protein